MGVYLKQKPKSMCFGKLNIRSIFFGKEKVWPAEYEIILNHYDVRVLTGASWATISVTANTNDWYVQAVCTAGGNWLTASKTSNSQARYEWTQNESTEERSGYLKFMIDGTEYARCEVTQAAQQLYITLSPTFVNLQNGLATAGTITVSTNAPDWQVEVGSNSSQGFTAEKYAVGSTYIVRWTVTENTTGAQRIGYINVYYGSVTATTQINQSAEIYVFTGLTTNPMSIGSAQTSFSISLVSRFGQTITEQPSVSIGYNPAMNVQLTSSASGGTTGQWNYVFSCNANDTESQRTTTIVFTQPGSNKTLTYVVQQAKKFVPQGIEGVTSAATYGNWILGTVATNKQSFPAGTFDINGVCVVTLNPITEDYTAHIDKLYYQTGPVVTGASPTNYTIENQDYSIPAGSTFTASGNTYNGKMIVSPNPRLQINGNVTGFTVTKN